MGRPHQHPQGWAWSELFSQGWSPAGGCAARGCFHGSALEALACHRSWEVSATMRWERSHAEERCELGSCKRLTRCRCFVGHESQVEIVLCPHHGAPAVRKLLAKKRQELSQ